MSLKGRIEVFDSEMSLTQRCQERFIYSGKIILGNISEVATSLLLCLIIHWARKTSMVLNSVKIGKWLYGYMNKVYFESSAGFYTDLSIENLLRACNA